MTTTKTIKSILTARRSAFLFGSGYAPLGLLIRGDKMKHYIDCTPKWTGLVPLFINWLQSGTKQQKQTARESIDQMAKAMDELMAHRKHGGLTCECGKTIKIK